MFNLLMKKVRPSTLNAKYKTQLTSSIGNFRNHHILVQSEYNIIIFHLEPSVWNTQCRKITNLKIRENGFRARGHAIAPVQHYFFVTAVDNNDVRVTRCIVWMEWRYSLIETNKRIHNEHVRPKHTLNDLVDALHSRVTRRLGIENGNKANYHGDMCAKHALFLRARFAWRSR